MIDNPDGGLERGACTDEGVLVAQAIQGDERSFTGLYDRYYDRIYRHLYYRVGRGEDAEDLTQQVFLQAWRAIGRYRQGTTPFVAWLFTIAHNTVVSFYRRNRVSVSLEADLTERPSPDGVEEPIEIRLEHERARRAIARLKPDQQLVLSMRFLENLDYRDIGTALGKSEGNVRVIQHRALQELRKLMESEDGRAQQ
jgi:RNA polymerase sigma-70 factor (ECF subfamily)